MTMFLTRPVALLFGLLVLTSSVQAQTFVGGNDRGGQIGRYLLRFDEMRYSGQHVVVGGNCLSACTMVLGIVPVDRMCVQDDARLGFHAAWMPDEDGIPHTSVPGTQALWEIYPPDIKRLIKRHGGLRRKMFFVSGLELPARYRVGCDSNLPIFASREPSKKKGSKAQASK